MTKKKIAHDPSTSSQEVLLIHVTSLFLGLRRKTQIESIIFVFSLPLLPDSAKQLALSSIKTQIKYPQWIAHFGNLALSLGFFSSLYSTQLFTYHKIFYYDKSTRCSRDLSANVILNESRHLPVGLFKRIRLEIWKS